MVDIQVNPDFDVLRRNPHAIRILVGGAISDGASIIIKDNEAPDFTQALDAVGRGQDVSSVYSSDIDMLLSSMTNGNDVYILTGAQSHLEAGWAVFKALNVLWMEASERLCKTRYGHLVSTVDIAAIGMVNGTLAVGFRRRGKAPYRGGLALAGGYLHLETDTNTMEAARRIALENSIPMNVIEQVETIAGAGRDPRGKNGWAITILHYALVTPQQQFNLEVDGMVFLTHQDILERMRLNEREFAFDHGRIAIQAVQRVKAKARYSNIPILMMDAPFKMADVLKMYASVTEAHFNNASMRRKLETLDIFDIGETLQRCQGKPVLLSLTPEAHSLTTFSKDLVSDK